MENLFIDYRDPLTGIIAIIFLIFLSSFITYSYNIYKEKKSRLDIKKFLKKFELGNLSETDYIHLYKTYNLSFDSILLLAQTFIHKGDYNKAIKIYLSLLEIINESAKKEELLQHLAKTYFKGGFLQRSKDVFLKILKNNPHNKEALKYLLLIYEKLGDFKKASEVLDSLEELNVVVVKDKIFILTLKTINDPLLSFEEKSKKLLSFFKINRSIQRLVADFLIKYDKKTFWEMIDKFEIEKILDLLWALDKKDCDFKKIQKDEFLQEIFSAKGYINSKKESKIFELQTLIALNYSSIKVNATLSFEYICSNCKKIMPLYSNRCPHCNNILTFKVKPILIKKQEINLEV